MLKIVKFFVILILIVGLLVGGLFLSVLEHQSNATAQSAEQVDNADSVTQLVRQLRFTLQRRNQVQNILIRKDQLDSLLGFANRAIPKLSGQANLYNFRSELLLSYQLPKTPFGRYLNVKVAVNAGDKLQVESVYLGYLHVPGEWALDLLIWLMDWHTDSDIASHFVEQIDKVRLYESAVIVTFLPLSDFLKQLNSLKDGVSVEQDQQLKEKTAYYMKLISRLEVRRERAYPSLTEYVAPMFEHARIQSAQSDPVLENEAVILALAIYAGHHRLANLVGNVQPLKDDVMLPDFRPLLAQRVDLARHFLISAAIKILSQQGVSTAIGEFKELMDRGFGGSGFSFVDLAADIAGVRFALAASDPQMAIAMQNVLANSDEESDFFPDIAGLPEGLDKATFTQVFGNVDSDAYKAQVELIENRINKVPLLRHAAVQSQR